VICLRSGHCCRTMPPPGLDVDADGACVHLRESNGMADCAIYADRPDACAAHEFPSEVCPIGRSVVGDAEARLIALGYVKRTQSSATGAGDGR